MKTGPGLDEVPVRSDEGLQWKAKDLPSEASSGQVEQIQGLPGCLSRQRQGFPEEDRMLRGVRLSLSSRSPGM